LYLRIYLNSLSSEERKDKRIRLVKVFESKSNPNTGDIEYKSYRLVNSTKREN